MLSKKNLFLLILLVFLIFTLFFKKNTGREATEVKPPPLKDTSLILEKIKSCYGKEQINICAKETAKFLSENFQPAEIFEALEKNEHQKEIFALCHATLHFYGQSQFEKLREPDAALGQGSPVCFAGYYHGVLEAYLKSRNLLIETDENALSKEIINLCSSLKTGNPKKYNEV